MARQPRPSGDSPMDLNDLSPRQAFREAVWKSDDLTADEKFAALAFAQYAHHGLERVWLARSELKVKTNMSSRRAHSAVHGLQAKGWLVKLDGDGGTGTRAQRYRLVIPVSDLDVGSQESSSDLDVGSLSDLDVGSRGSSSDPVSASSDPVSAPSDLDVETRPLDLYDLPQSQRVKLPRLLTLLAGEGIGEEDAPAILDISKSLGTDHPVGRLCEYKPHRDEVIAKWRAENAEQLRREEATMPRCEEHDLYLATKCQSCWSEIVAGDRPRARLGRIHTPAEEVAS